MAANNELQRLGIGALAISYLRDHDCQWEATWFAAKYGYPVQQRNDDNVLRKLIIQWLWKEGMYPSATGLAKQLKLEHVIREIQEESVVSGGTGSGGGGGVGSGGGGGGGAVSGGMTRTPRLVG